MASSRSPLFFACVAFNFIFLTSIFAKESPAPAKVKKEPIDLTDYDRRILENGEISGFHRFAGTVVAVVPGLGLGHAVHGRYLYKGMFFTLMEVVALGMTFSPTGEAGQAVGATAFLGLKVWEFVDSIVGPKRDNLRYRQLQSLSLDSADTPMKFMPVPIVRIDDSGQRTTQLGLALTWNIP